MDKKIEDTTLKQMPMEEMRESSYITHNANETLQAIRRLSGQHGHQLHDHREIKTLAILYDYISNLK